MHMFSVTITFFINSPYYSVTFSVMSEDTTLFLHLLECVSVFIQLNQLEPFWGYPIVTP